MTLTIVRRQNFGAFSSTSDTTQGSMNHKCGEVNFINNTPISYQFHDLKLQGFFS